MKLFSSFTRFFWLPRDSFPKMTRKMPLIVKPPDDVTGTMSKNSDSVRFLTTFSIMSHFLKTMGSDNIDPADTPEITSGLYPYCCRT